MNSLFSLSLFLFVIIIVWDVRLFFPTELDMRNRTFLHVSRPLFFKLLGLFLSGMVNGEGKRPLPMIHSPSTN